MQRLTVIGNCKAGADRESLWHICQVLAPRHRGQWLTGALLATPRHLGSHQQFVMPRMIYQLRLGDFMCAD